jgi:hypothetical protein
MTIFATSRETETLMHVRQHRPDHETTKAMSFASKYSYVSHRIHPGTEHGCQYLAGFEDIGKRRQEVFERDGFLCVDCGFPATHDDPLELAHSGNTKISRCDCWENLKTKHHSCHGRNDHHGRF